MRKGGTLIGLAIALALGGAAVAKGGLSVETVSNRADLISGGDALVRVMIPAGENPESATLTLNGKPTDVRFQINRGFGGGPGAGYLALVTGLVEGKNTLVLTSKGRKSTLTITNHANGGPLFSGPQIKPWTCAPGALNAQCDRPATYSWSYMPAGGREFKPYDPAKPAAGIARVTTSNGASVPYIVRTESFTQDRSGVSVAALYDPAKPWTPFAPQSQWNKGVYVLQGSGCGTGYSEKPAGSPMNDNALKKGFLVVTVALLHNTINCNPVIQAEAALMAKEHVAETYGLFEIFFGQGGSGGAISQIMDQNAYPGLYDGIILNHLFADSDASRKAAYDCRLIYDAVTKQGGWSEAQRVAVAGMTSGCNASPTRFEIYAPSLGTGCDIPAADKFNEKTNPKGVRCTLQDYEVNQVGRRPDGAANGRIDTEGVQYGLKALKAGTITPAQFVQLNADIGGHDVNFNRLTTRTKADKAGLKALYQTGLNNTENNLSETAILETRLQATDFHQPFHAVMVRARIDRAQGGHDNYVRWRSMTTSDPSFNDAFDVMVSWLKAIKADTRAVPKARKVVDNKPAAAKDRCTLGDGKDQPESACPRPVELARVLAGAPDANDIGKCALKALSKADYGPALFTDDQWASLKKTFPTGVCDYAKPPVDFAMTIPWLTYAGGKPAKMPVAPVSR